MIISLGSDQLVSGKFVKRCVEGRKIERKEKVNYQNWIFARFTFIHFDGEINYWCLGIISFVTVQNVILLNLSICMLHMHTHLCKMVKWQEHTSLSVNVIVVCIRVSMCIIFSNIWLLNNVHLVVYEEFILLWRFPHFKYDFANDVSSFLFSFHRNIHTLLLYYFFLLLLQSKAAKCRNWHGCVNESVWNYQRTKVNLTMESNLSNIDHIRH